MESPRAIDERARRKQVADKAARVAALKAKQAKDVTYSGGGVGKPDNSPAGKAFKKNLRRIYEESNKPSEYERYSKELAKKKQGK
jgi:hypothetical protein